MQWYWRKRIDLGPQLLPVGPCQRGCQVAGEVRCEVRAFFILEQMDKVS